MVGRLFLPLTALLAHLSLADRNIQDEDVAVGVELLQTKARIFNLQPAQGNDHDWPCKGGSLNHSAASFFTGPHSMTKPSWIFNEPDLTFKALTLVPSMMKVFHGSPVVDSDKNVYIQSTTGWIYSLTQNGSLRWSTPLSDYNPGNLALLNGSAYTCSQDGKVWSLDMSTGRVNWVQQVSTRCPDDTHSLSAVGSTVLTACDALPGLGNFAVCAVSTLDGRTNWKYEMNRVHGSRGYNQVYAVVANTVYFGDVSGAVYAVSLDTGTEIWYSPGLPTATFTTGGMVLGPNNRIYFGFNDGAKGTLRVHDLATGNVLWATNFKEGLNAQPAVGRLGSSGPLAVVVTVGNNVECELQTHLTKPKYAQIIALDADTSEIIWTFDLPENSMSCMGNSLLSFCCPDVWGQPSIAADGTVYANWSGGYSFAVRDANGDRTIDLHDPAEVSSYYHGRGSNGNTAIVPGLTVAISCTALLGYQS